MLLYENKLFRILIEAIEIFDIDKHEVRGVIKFSFNSDFIIIL